MDPYGIQQLTAVRHADLVREADESRVARFAREERDEARPAPQPKRGPSRVRRLGIAG